MDLDRPSPPSERAASNPRPGSWWPVSSGSRAMSLVALYRIPGRQRVIGSSRARRRRVSRAHRWVDLVGGNLIGAAGVCPRYPRADPIVGLSHGGAILVGSSRAAGYPGVRPGSWTRSTPAVTEAVELAARVPGVEDVASVRIRWIGHQLEAETHIVVDCELPDHRESCHRRVGSPRGSSMPCPESRTLPSTSTPRVPTSKPTRTERRGDHLPRAACCHCWSGERGSRRSELACRSRSCRARHRRLTGRPLPARAQHLTLRGGGLSGCIVPRPVNSPSRRYVDDDPHSGGKGAGLVARRHELSGSRRCARSSLSDRAAR